MKEAPIIWLNGSLKDWADGSTHVMSHTLHYGSGCFEGIRCYATDNGPAIFRLEDHIARLENSASLYKMPLGFSLAEIVKGCMDLINENKLESAYIRPIVFYGYDSLGVHPRECPVRVAIACFNWGAYLGADGVANGVRITVSSWRKFHNLNMPSTAKANGQYLNSLLAVQEAHERGYDEALLLNMEGDIAEGSGQNLFIVKDQILHTNDETASILLGITRDTIIKVARDLGHEVRIGPLTMDMLRQADEAFFTGTASEITPIREVDGHTIGTGKPGDISVQLQELYFDIVKGRNQQYNHWLTYPRATEAKTSNHQSSAQAQPAQQVAVQSQA